MSTQPVTLAELLTRGMDDRMTEVLNLLIGDHFPPHARGKITREESWALGYGEPCPCGERGMMQGDEIDEELGICAECAAVEREPHP